MSKFKLHLGDFETAKDKAVEIDDYIGQSVEFANDAESKFASTQSGEWADAFSRTYQSCVQICLEDLSDVASQLSEDYASALNDAGNLVEPRNAVLSAVGCSASNSDVIALTTGYHIPSKCSSAKDSLTDLRTKASAIKSSTEFCLITDSPDSGYNKTKISGILTDLIVEISSEKRILSDLSEAYSDFKAKVEEFEDIYSECFNPDIFDEVEQANQTGNDWTVVTGLLSDAKFANKLFKWGSTAADIFGSSNLWIFSKLFSSSWVDRDIISTSSGLVKATKLQNKGIFLRTYLDDFNSNFLKKSGDLNWDSLGGKSSRTSASKDLGKVLDALYVGGEMVQSWFTTDGTTEDKVTATISTGIWEGSKVVVKTATSKVSGAAGATAGAAIGTAICPGVGTVIGAAVGYIAASAATDFAVDKVYEVAEDCGAKDALNSAVDAVADVVTTAANKTYSFFSNLNVNETLTQETSARLAA